MSTEEDECHATAACYAGQKGFALQAQIRHVGVIEIIVIDF